MKGIDKRDGRQLRVNKIQKKEKEKHSTMSSWARQTNRDGKVPSYKRRGQKQYQKKNKYSSSNENIDDVDKNNKINRRNKNKSSSRQNKQTLQTTPRKRNGMSKKNKSPGQGSVNKLVDRSTSPISPSTILTKKGLKHINMIQKDALLNVLNVEGSEDNNNNIGITESTVEISNSTETTETTIPLTASSTKKENETSGSSKSTSSFTPVKNHLLDDFKQQIQEKKIRKEKERLANLEYERQIQKNADKYDYFFGSANKRGGGGTPVRHNGKSIANLKLIGKDLVTIQTPTSRRRRGNNNRKNQSSVLQSTTTRTKSRNNNNNNSKQEDVIVKEVVSKKSIMVKRMEEANKRMQARYDELIARQSQATASDQTDWGRH